MLATDMYYIYVYCVFVCMWFGRVYLIPTIALAFGLFAFVDLVKKDRRVRLVVTIAHVISLYFLIHNSPGLQSIV